MSRARLVLASQAGAVKSLHFPRSARCCSGGNPGLSSGLQAPAGGAGSPNLTPFTPGVSLPGAQRIKSLASTNFATRAFWEAAGIIHLGLGGPRVERDAGDLVAAPEVLHVARHPGFGLDRIGLA